MSRHEITNYGFVIVDNESITKPYNYDETVIDNVLIGAFRNSQSDVIFAHAHITGIQASSMESVLNVGLYLEKMGFYSQCHIKTCLYSSIYIQNTSYR